MTVSLQQWVNSTLNGEVALTALAGDASLRRYFRARHQGQTYIVMDAQAAKHDNLQAFVAIANCLREAGLKAPYVHQADFESGIILLSDLGDVLLSQQLTGVTANELYAKALDELIKMQRITALNYHQLPKYDRNLMVNEMQLFVDWFCDRYLQLELTEEDRQIIASSFELLTTEALSQPTVFVHRDYHSRNLMLLNEGEIGILDFQDAVWGPITYDLVSLVKDCYIDWPEAMVQSWALGYKTKLEQVNLIPATDPQLFLRWFDYMGLQRHLKCLGIFARLNIRDQKPGYLQYLPRVLNYALQVSERYAELNPLAEFLAKIKL